MSNAVKEKVKKSRKFVLIVFLTLVILGLLDTCVPEILDHGRLEFITFDGIDSLELLDEYATEKEIGRDSALNGLAPLESYCREIVYDGKSFIVRAYVFSSFEESAKCYYAYKNPMPEEDSHGMADAGIGKADYTTIEDNKVIRIESRRLMYIKALTGFLLDEYPDDFRKLRKKLHENLETDSPSCLLLSNKESV